MLKLIKWILEFLGIIETPENKNNLPFPIMLIALAFGTSLIYDFIQIYFK